MRYITVPKPVIIDSRKLPDGTHPELSFSVFIRQSIGSDRRWLSDSAWENAYEDLINKISKDIAVGAVIELPDTSHEKLEQVVRDFPYDAEAKADLLPLIKAVTRAPKSKQESEKEPTASESEPVN
jgi:hypothetical protein